MARSPFLHAVNQHWLKPLTLVALLAPGLYVAAQWALAWFGYPNELGFNAAEWTHHFLGETALRILLVTLAITPLRDITRWGPLLRIRRRIGLAAFFYAALHIVAYLWLDLLWSFAALWDDVLKRTYITFGMAAFVLLVPLAVTSTNGMIRRLGAETWKRLHWLIYPLAILAVLHHFFMEKGNQPGPLVHGAILLVLLGWRIGKWMSPKPPARLRKPSVAAG